VKLFNNYKTIFSIIVDKNVYSYQLTILLKFVTEEDLKQFRKVSQTNNFYNCITIYYRTSNYLFDLFFFRKLDTFVLVKTNVPMSK